MTPRTTSKGGASDDATNSTNNANTSEGDVVSSEGTNTNGDNKGRHNDATVSAETITCGDGSTDRRSSMSDLRRTSSCSGSSCGGTGVNHSDAYGSGATGWQHKKSTDVVDTKTD